MENNSGSLRKLLVHLGIPTIVILTGVNVLVRGLGHLVPANDTVMTLLYKGENQHLDMLDLTTRLHAPAGSNN